MTPIRTDHKRVPLSYGGFQVHQDVGYQSAIKGMIHGEIAGLLTAGWSPDEVRMVFGEHAILGRSDWPSLVRGLPLIRRKSLAQFGLHGLHTQLLLLISQAVPTTGRQVGELQDVLVSALDTNALRGVDHRILEVAHAHRRNEKPTPHGGRRKLRGVCVSDQATLC